MEPDHLAVQISYLRCCASSGFFDTFYDTLLAKSPEVAQKFTNTDFTRQKRMVKESLFKMVCQASLKGEARAEVERIAEIHSHRHVDIPPALYSLWLDSLCKAIKVHDPGYTPELEELWRRKMQEGIDIMIDRY